MKNAEMMANQGWRVFPVRPKDKKALIKEWTKKATTNLDTIKAWGEKYKNCNWGILCGKTSGIFVIDIDPRNGGDHTAERLAGDGRVFPLTYTVGTPSGGKHFYYQYPEKMLVKSTSVAFDSYGGGIDCQSDGRAVNGPLSVARCTLSFEYKTYTVQPHPIAEAPEWLLEMVKKELEPLYVDLPSGPVPRGRKEKYAQAAFEKALQRFGSTPDGQRNIELNNTALRLGAFVNAGALDGRTVENALYNEALRVGLPSSEAKAAISSGLSAAKRKGGDPFRTMTQIKLNECARGLV